MRPIGLEGVVGLGWLDCTVRSESDIGDCLLRINIFYQKIHETYKPVLWDAVKILVNTIPVLCFRQSPRHFSCNMGKHYLILIIFNWNFSEKVGNQNDTFSYVI